VDAEGSEATNLTVKKRAARSCTGAGLVGMGACGRGILEQFGPEQGWCGSRCRSSWRCPMPGIASAESFDVAALLCPNEGIK